MGTLYVVATPIGNLGDLTERARATLLGVQVVAAEDTRRTRILLNHIGAGRPRLVSFHAHSTRSRVEQLIQTLQGGESVAVVTDAGTPTISDPGGELVQEARASGVPVVVIPGPSAVPAALSVSGLPADRYIFLGFPPRRGVDRRRLLDTAAASALTVVMFEAAPRLDDLLEDLAERCGSDRQVVVAREMTKIHEEVRAGGLGEVREHYAAHPPKGEITVVLAGATDEPAGASEDLMEAIQARARVLLAEGASRRDVARVVADELKVSRNEAYRLVTSL